MTTFRDGAESPTLMERHQKIGQLLAEAFPTNHPALLDWAEVGFALKRLQPEAQGVVPREKAE